MLKNYNLKKIFFICIFQITLSAIYILIQHVIIITISEYKFYMYVI